VSAFILTVLKLLGSIVSGGLLFQAFVSSHHSKPVTKIAGVVVSLITLLMFVVDLKDIFPDDEADKTEQIYWESVEKHPNAASYRAYLNQYPDGKFVTLARTQIAGYAKAMPIAEVKQAASLPEKIKTPIVVENEGQGAHASNAAQPSTSSDNWQMIAHYQIKDGLVKDTKTGLMWMRCSLGQYWQGSDCLGNAANYTWDQAMNSPKQVDYAGYNDWRVPTREELKTLVYCSSGKTQSVSDEGLSACAGEYASPTIVKAVFPETPAWFWSSSPYANSSSYAWYVFFGYGYDDWSYKYNDYQVRLVRNGQ
jgi:hypothetical protein